MRKVSEYQQHVSECLQMASGTANSEHKRMLVDMAEAWKMLARARVAQLEKRGLPADYEG
jgi:hypothetical protein